MRKVKELIKDNASLLVVGILALALVVRMVHFSKSLWFDEWSYSLKGALRDMGMVLEASMEDKSAPLYRFIMFFWTSVHTDHQISVRMPPFILGIASVFLSYVAAARASGRKAGYLAATLLALAPAHIWYSQEATPYSMYVFLVLAIFLLYQKVVDGASGAVTYMAYFITILAVLFINWGGVAVLLAVSLLSLRKTNGRKKDILIFNLLALLFMAGFLFLKSRIGVIGKGPGYMRPFDVSELLKLFFNWFSMGNTIWPCDPYQAGIKSLAANPWMLALQSILVYIFIRGTLAFWSEKEERAGKNIVVFMLSLPVFFLLLTAFGLKHIYIERAALPALPFFIITMAAGVFACRNRLLRRLLCVFLVSVSLVSVLSLWKKPAEWTVYKPNPDWIKATRYFGKEYAASGNMIYVLAGNKTPLLSYYEKNLGLIKGNLIYVFSMGGEVMLSANVGETQGIVENILERGTSNWLEAFYFSEFNWLLSEKKKEIQHFYILDLKGWSGNIGEFIDFVKKDKRYVLVEKKEFTNIDIYKFKVL